MNAVPAGSSPQAPTLSRAQARVAWFALAGGLVVAAVASAVVQLPPDPRLRVVLLPVVGFLTLADLVLGFVVPASIRRKAATSGAPPPAALPGVQMIVGCALALGAGLFACVAHLLTREPLFLGAVAVCLGAMLAWYPSEARWARLAPRPATGAQRMMRE